MTDGAPGPLLVIGAHAADFVWRAIPAPRIYYFEPHHPEQCGFLPNIFVDFTRVADRKEQAMAAMASQTYLRDHYRQRSEQRAMQSRYFGAGREVRNVEAFQLATPRLVERL